MKNMKKSTLAIAALLTTLSAAVIMPAAYADDTTPAPTTATTPDTTTTPAPDATTTPAPEATTTPAPEATDGSDDNGS